MNSTEGNNMAPQSDLKKVVVLYVGGTMGMKKNHRGVYAPVHDIFLAKMKSSPELHDPELAKLYSIKDDEMITQSTLHNQVIVYQFREYQPLLDSSNLTPKEWILIAKRIEENYNAFDGVVLLTGTDTMAYTASILSFMFKNLQKPVVLTGSQIPIFDQPSDAKNHILSSLIFASCYDIPEVCVFFETKLMRGNRVRKTQSSHVDAFDSPNYHYLAETGFYTRVHRNYIYPKPEKGPLTVFTDLCERVGILFMFPTITENQLLSFLEPTLEGLVLMAYGAGNIPSRRKDLLAVLKNAVDRGVTVVLVSQCLQGPVTFVYEAGKCLEDVGVISCYDMTVEAAFAKLTVVCGMTKKPEERAQLMKQNLRGEMEIYS